MKCKGFVILIGLVLFFPASCVFAYHPPYDYKGGGSGYDFAYTSVRTGAHWRAQEPNRIYEFGIDRYRKTPPVLSRPPYPSAAEQPAKETLKEDTKSETENASTAVSTVASTASYTVQAGDTLFRIAKFFDTTVDLLMLENQITDPTKLQIGQQLTIPAKEQHIGEWLDNSSSINKVFYATLTAYTAGFESTGKTPSHPAYGITASGAKVKENYTIAVDPDVIPLGSLVYIEGLGIRKAEDVGSAIKGKKIDVYIPDLEEALEFGVKKNVKVHVLGPDRKPKVRIASAKDMTF